MATQKSGYNNPWFESVGQETDSKKGMQEGFFSLCPSHDLDFDCYVPAEYTPEASVSPLKVPLAARHLLLQFQKKTTIQKLKG